MKKLMKRFCLLGALVCMLFAVTVVAHPQTTYAAKKNGIVTVDGKKYYYKDGVKQTKWVTIESGKNKGKYYFDPKSKAAVTGLQTIKSKLYYFDKKTCKLVTDRYGIKIGKKYYRISSKGVATKVSTVEGMAGIQLDACGGDMKKAFTWAADLKYINIETAGMKEADFAIYGFRYNRGDCNVQAACFSTMAKLLGKKAKFVQGYASNKSQTVFSKHAWVSIGKKVYDPNFVSYIMKPANGGKTKKQAVAISYGFAYSDHSGHFYYCDLDKNLYE